MGKDLEKNTYGRELKSRYLWARTLITIPIGEDFDNITYGRLLR